jgi:hypothetical protein
MASPNTPSSSRKFLKQSTSDIELKETNGSENNEEPTLHSSKARFWVDVVISSAYVVALILALVHHAFLATLNHRDVAQYSQEERGWIQGASNMLGKVIAGCLGAVVSTALIQGVRSLITTTHFF